MKKLLSLALVLIFTLAMLAGCASKETAKTGDDKGIVKVGLGHITSIKSSKDLGTDKDGKEVLPVGQVDTIIAAVGFDKDGKVVSVTIDNAQTKVEFNKDLSLKSDIKAEQKTKVELKDAYGMKKASKIGKEWYEQIAALENWMKGKTVADIKNMKVEKKDDAHPSVPAVEELKSSVSVSVEGYIAAVEEAWNNAFDAKGATKVGLGHKVEIGKSKGLGTDKDGKQVLPLAQVDTIISATAFDANGKVVATVIDNAQTKVEFDATGKVTSNKADAPKTKLELKDAYGMKKASKIGKEWFEQSKALSDWMKGKTVADIKNMKVEKKDDAHPAVPAVEELKSSVSVSVEGYIFAVEEASKNAK